MMFLLQCSCGDGPANIWLLLAMVAGVWLIAGWIKSFTIKKTKGGSLMNKTGKVGIVVVLIVTIITVIAIKQNKSSQDSTVFGSDGQIPEMYKVQQLTGKGIPVLVDVGADTCIPCKLMAPILEELKEELKGKIQVQFLNLNKYPKCAEEYKISLMPTQIFYDASGKERFRHEGFFSKEDILAKWKELGVNLPNETSQAPTFERLKPARVDERAKDTICYMCDGDINPKTLVTVQTEKGPVRICSLHCYFIMYSCLTEDKTDFEKKVSVTDITTGNLIPVENAVFLLGQDEKTGRPWIKAFADRNTAETERSTAGGNILSFGLLQEKELSNRCGFCDRAVYPQDAAEVIVDNSLHTWGCCSHCALGVAARTGENIEVHEKDRLTGEKIIVKTFDGTIASLEPKSAVAWFGQRQKADGTWASAGCFHQGFFINADNLKKWVEQNPYETGRLISINQVLADKMKLSSEQIEKACKIGECVPK
jgi:thioredoxin 1